MRSNVEAPLILIGHLCTHVCIAHVELCAISLRECTEIDRHCFDHCLCVCVCVCVCVHVRMRMCYCVY